MSWKKFDEEGYELHTPGPWKRYGLGLISGDPEGVYDWVVSQGDPGVVDMRNADEQLILTAPELLTALKYMVEVYGSHALIWPADKQHPCELARAVIAKAEGRNR